MPCSRKSVHVTITDFALMAVLLARTGCGGVAQRTPVPVELTTKVEISGIAKARFWGDEWPEWSIKALQTATEAFDPVYMGKRFDRGYQMALQGYAWEKAPPGFIVNPE